MRYGDRNLDASTLDMESREVRAARPERRRGSFDELSTVDITPPRLAVPTRTLADVADAPLSAVRDNNPDPTPTTHIGHHIVLREVGRGGMGVTYLAYDESLDRKIVLKLVRAELSNERTQTRLMREARALARLAHPNIVAVHEVGKHGESAFIAMEFVAGMTTDLWRRAAPRSWRDVVEVFRQAGEGVRAAHATGLVHRDIKPSNIIVGNDGRVRVLDFGLARLRDPRSGCPTTRSTLPLTEDRRELCSAAFAHTAVDDESSEKDPVWLSLTDGLAGTLPYMAPEYLDGGPATVETDQFAFCVSLFEMLYGTLPFSGRSPLEFLRQMRAGAIEPAPLDGYVPDWLREVVVRGLASEPAERWPSMAALLDALGCDPGVSRRRFGRQLALGGALSVLAALALVGNWKDTDLVAGVCSGGEEQMEQVWGREQHHDIAHAMVSTALPYAVDTWTHTSALLDDYRAQWLSAYTDACEATAVRKVQSDELRDQRMRCLSRHLGRMRVLVGELQRIDGDSLEHAIDAVGALPPVNSCADLDYLSRRIPPPSEIEAAREIERVDEVLMRATQLRELGRYGEGLELIAGVAADAATLDYPPLIARARLQLGALELENAAYESAERHLRQSYFTARSAGEHDVAVHAATQLVFLLAHLAPRLDDADEWAKHLVSEMPWSSSDAIRANANNTLGVLALSEGRHTEALAFIRRALTQWEQSLGPTHPRVTWALDNLGSVHFARGEYREAGRLYRRALQVRESALGAHHPSVAYISNNLGAALHLSGSYDDASTSYQRALEIAEHSLGDEHPFLAGPMVGLAFVHLATEQPAEALLLAGRAHTLLKRQPNASLADLSEARFAIVRARAATGDVTAETLALAGQVREDLRSSVTSTSLIDLDTVETWLDEHQAR